MSHAYPVHSVADKGFLCDLARLDMNIRSPFLVGVDNYLVHKAHYGIGLFVVLRFYSNYFILILFLMSISARMSDIEPAAPKSNSGASRNLLMSSLKAT